MWWAGFGYLRSQVGSSLGSGVGVVLLGFAGFVVVVW